MRKDHYSPPAKWTREFRGALKLSDAHFKVYSYLENALESHATGIYFITLSAIAEMVCDERDFVARIMEELESAGLILWDAKADVVYVPCVCGEQFRWSGRAGKDPEKDFRVTDGRRHIQSLPTSYLIELFLSRWPIFKTDEGAYQGAYQAPSQGAYQGATQAPYQAPTTTTFSTSKILDPSQTPPTPDAPKFRPLDDDGIDIDINEEVTP
ncbi:hypothetical protein SAMN05421644_11028 [Allochromatium warmingii]|uniref:Uncharacterized protein n=1 Tax=Allochromatium warmingii TaxID=61595 RepID=A0A1H3DXK6_ALLWA|nr:hypothetical protein [Allochromatium warmingii]SDX70369.1 hypothetical protein SAMN05421644_11028 [Allochromatium warmingii]